MLSLGMAVIVAGEARADLLMAKNAPRVEISANRLRSTRVAGGDFDDRLQKVQIEAVVKNLDFNRPANGLKLRYWVLAEALVDRKALLVIDAGVVDVNLTSTPEARELRHKGEMVTLKWDDTNAIFGQRYKGWVLVLLNDKQEVVAVKSNMPTWQTNFQRAFALRAGSWCGMDLKPAKNPGY